MVTLEQHINTWFKSIFNQLIKNELKPWADKVGRQASFQVRKSMNNEVELFITQNMGPSHGRTDHYMMGSFNEELSEVEFQFLGGDRITHHISGNSGQLINKLFDMVIEEIK